MSSEIESKVTAALKPIFVKNFDHAAKQRAYEQQSGMVGQDDTRLEISARSVAKYILIPHGLTHVNIVFQADFQLLVQAAHPDTPDNPVLNFLISK